MEHKKRVLPYGTLALLSSLGAALHAQPTTESGPTPELEAFILRETDLAQSGDLMPTSRQVFSVFGTGSLLDTPRSVTVITPEMMKQFDIKDFGDLAKLGAGTQQANYYGVPGVPSLRGAKGSVFFNGMQRAYQRNEMPLSFGSLEGMDLVKGPAPAHFGAALVGGYANLIPKSPYFDEKRGSVQLEVGENDSYRVQADFGGPTLFRDRPAAYRVSITSQLADSYYDNVGNDFISLYASTKIQLKPDVTFFSGAEYFNYKSNENAGWNRLTQNLARNGQYVIGEPISVSDSRWGGNANRRLHTVNPALVVPDAAVLARFGDAATARAAGLLDLSDAGDRATAYAGIPAGDLPFIAQTASGFQYTPGYFAGGGEVFTQKVDGSTVLADPSDFANSQNFFWFADYESKANPDRSWKNQFIFDYITTEKRSSYSYAIDTKQLVLENKLSLTEDFGFLNSSVTYGGSVRFTKAEQLQDFWDEPFSRRDITAPGISGNSVVFAGGLDPEGNIRWNSPFAGFAPGIGGNSVTSDLFQYSLFGYAESKITDTLTTYTSLLGAFAHYKTGVPREASVGFPAPANVKGDMWYYSASFSPVLKLTENWSAYVMAQYGTAIEPLQGGPILGENALSRNKLLEIGTKASLLDNRLFVSLAGYMWSQSTFSANAGGNTTIQSEGQGVELELTYAVTDRLTLIAAANHQIVELENPVRFRVVPTTEEGFALFGGELQTPFSQNQGGFDPSLLGPPANNPKLRINSTPATQIKLFAVYNLENGFGVSGGPIWSSSYYADYDRTVSLPSSIVVNASVYYRQPTYEISLSVDNLTGEDYFYGADPIFASGGIITKAPDRQFKLSYTYKF